MVCTSVKDGVECTFMKKNGCQFNGGTCHTIIEQCDGCQRIIEATTGKYCMTFPDPSMKWRAGICAMATHMKGSSAKSNGKLNPLKASKRGAH